MSEIDPTFDIKVVLVSDKNLVSYTYMDAKSTLCE